MKTKIIYEDDALLVIYKPAGIASESARVTQTDVFSELKAYRKGGFVGLVHRLDQPVEGLLAVAKTKEVAANLSRQLTGGSLKKSYLAVVVCGEAGKLPTDNQKIVLSDYLYKNPKTKMAEIVCKEHENAQPAKLSYFCKKAAICGEDGMQTALMEIELMTGRFHQIRAQMAHAGLPLLGDLKYGSAQVKALSEKLSVKTVALCAHKLSFLHPQTKEEKTFEIEPENTAFLTYKE